MSLFRSEEAALYQLFLQSEAAYTSIGEIGELGLVQFLDMTPELNAFSRHYVTEVRRCDEMQRKIHFIEKEVRKNDHLVIQDAPHPTPAPPIGEMVQLENNLEKMENELRELLSNQEQLEKNFLELTELKEVLTRTSSFFQEASQGEMHLGQSEEERAMMGNEPGDQGSTGIGTVAGVINRERLMAFERVLWRICRGNVYVKHTDLEADLHDPSTGDKLQKSVFIVFYQGSRLGIKVKKVCEGFHATMYPCPEQPNERQEMLNGVETRIQDLTVVLDQTRDLKSKVLQNAAANLGTWVVQAKKIKSIYHTLNLFQVSQKYLQVQCWIPHSDVPKIQSALRRGTELSGSSVPSVLNRISTKLPPPTFHRVNKFTGGFQSIIDAYGMADYREMNPMPFTCITFPFLFAVMFGDSGHGLIMTMFAFLLILKENQIQAAKSKNEIFLMFFGGRYLIFLMGLFSIYTGLMYNDVFSKALNVFGSSWNVANQPGVVDQDFTGFVDIQINPQYTFDGNHPYPFGFDPIWQVAENKLLFLNSFKMKFSVVAGVIHMMFGVWLSLFNHMYFKKYLNVIAEFIPQVLFLGCLFGYLVFMIFYKWFAFTANDAGDAPNLLTTLIDMFMSFGSTPDPLLFSGQAVIQPILVVIVAICVPWMLLLKPAVIYFRHKKTQSQAYEVTKPVDKRNVNSETDESRALISDGEPGTSSDGSDSPNGSEFADDEPFNFGEIMILQCIHTIEFCLGCISHTASYLRLWALSLAHAELSEVLWQMVFQTGLKMQGAMGVVAIVLTFAFWAVLTIAILLLMEGLSAFLHALRLHWVEFQSKFYHGDGYQFQPFTFQKIMENPFDE